MATNRALRATAFIVFGWVFGRVLILANGEVIKPPVTSAVSLPPPIFDQAPVSPVNVLSGTSVKPVRPAWLRARAFLAEQMLGEKARPLSPATFALATPSETQPPPSMPVPLEALSAITPVAQPPRVASSLENSRGRSWSPTLSGWAIIRSSQGSPPLATNGQLGASQAGFRVQQPLLRPDDALQIAANLRVSTPIGQSLGKEAGLGVALQRRGRVPIELIIERRIGLDRGGRNAFALIAVAGVDDIELAKNTYLSGYGQSGVVGLRANDGFADGAIRIDRAIDRSKRWRVGAGLWGSAQPGVARLDVGPIVALRQRIGTANARIALEYRWRVEGDARPGSGPALSIGTDF
jgi:hypothetical protein